VIFDHPHNADSVLGWLCGRELVHQAQNALLWAV
jgi:hypothetical protein